MKITQDIVDAFITEAELRADVDSAVSIKCGLENKLQNPKTTQTPFARINVVKQARLNNDYEKHMAIVMRHRKNVFDLRTQLHEQQNKIDEKVLQHLEESNAPELKQILRDCEELDTEEPIENFHAINSPHKERIYVFVRQIWQDAQQQHFSGKEVRYRRAV